MFIMASTLERILQMAPNSSIDNNNNLLVADKHLKNGNAEFCNFSERNDNLFNCFNSQEW